MRKLIHFNRIVIFLVLIAEFGISQTTSPYNASYWSAYADKLQLTGKERQEFLSSHKRLQTPVPVASPQVTQTATFNSKGPNNNNQVMAPPCFNPDFEMGSLAGWTVSSGFHPGFNALGCCPNGGGQQLVTSGAGLDPFGGFPVVLPGGNFSLRLGNSINGGEADRIEQQFLVTPANANFSYRYAVVLEDPNHPINQQPSFQVEMFDTLNNLVPCTYFYVAAGQNIPGFFNSTTPGVIYKPWTTVLVDLTPYIGQNITIRFTTFDCSLGGHFGYAYIDGVCQAFVGGGSATVCAGSTHTFCAPNGLASYMWNGPSVTNYIGQCCPVTAPGVYTVSTTLFSNCNGPPFTYTLTTQTSPTANALPNQTVCANNNTVSLTGSITGFTSTPQWFSSGSGVFTNTANLVTTYTPSAAEIAAGSTTISLTTLGNGVCPPSTSSIQVVILPSPTVNAGPDQNLCSTQIASLNGNVIGATNTGSWVSSGTGTFSPSNTVLNPTYAPSAADIAAGSVTLALTSTNNQSCLYASDLVTLFFQNPPLANAGINPTVCANNSTVSLSGTILNFAATPVWSSSGSGVFTNSTALNTNYVPSAFDISTGTVLITLSTANNGVCPASNSTVQLTITQAPVVAAGPNQTICSTAAVSLNGNVSGPTTTGFWTSSGSGAFSPSPNLPITVYNPSPADILSGNIIFTLTSTGNGNCIAVTNTLSVGIAQLATVSAGPNQAICATSNTLGISGTVSGVTSTGFWTSNGSGAYNPGAGFLNNTYFISPSDIINGSITFTLNSTNNGPCPSVIDTVMIKIVPLAQVSAGANQLVCESQNSIALNGSVNNGGGVWSGGTGIYTPSSATVNTTYFMGSTDVVNGFVTFTLTSTNNGPCASVSDTVRVGIRRMAVVSAGASQSICSTSSSVALNGSVTVGSTVGLWTSLGTGNFLPSPTILSPSYVYSGADLAAGGVSLVLTSLSNGVCPPASDTVFVRLYADPVIDLKSDTSVCSYQNPIEISANLTGNYGGLFWTTSGNGTFIPGPGINPTKYKFGSSELSSGQVNLTLALSNNGPCANKSGSIHVIIRPSPIASFAASSYTIFNPADPINFTNSSQLATIYNWDFGDGNQSSQTHPSHTFPGAGYFTVRLIASNQYNCLDTADALITVKSDIKFPNAFTPNTNGTNGGGYIPGDLSNDVFFPYVSGVTEYNLKIFNRYGELIFQSNDVKIGWDGYFNGKLCQQDAYVWKANVKFFDGTVFDKTGSVTLLR